ncbi:MAG: M48 family metallopeptidase [Candidatus Gracilibacteria bacterium]|nr:M48 family metallopeptidase [Candidatus Gracilibacteria bacterium]
MEKEITIKKQTIRYKVKKCNFSKSLKISLFPGPRVLVTMPKYCSFRRADTFVKQNFDKIIENLSKFRDFRPLRLINRDMNYEKNKEKARELIDKILSIYSAYYGFKYTGFSVRNQSSRWGSCSSRAHLNFNYKLLFLPLRLAEYVIVHELCHLKEMNHSDKFWKEVSRIFPNYRELDRELKKYGFFLQFQP